MTEGLAGLHMAEVTLCSPYLTFDTMEFERMNICYLTTPTAGDWM